MKKPGDRAELGDIIGHPQEPHRRYARIVGFRKDNCRPMERNILRLYVNEEERWPTGKYVTTWLIVPWEGESR